MITTDYDAQIAAIEADTAELPQPNGTEEEYCTIDLDTREITIPACFKTIAVYSDHRAETLWFTCDRYFDNTDLGDASVGAAIIYQGVNGVYGKDYAIYKDVMKSDEEKIIFGWTIQDDATQCEGDLVFGLRLYQVDESGVFTYKLNTKVNHITVEHGLDYAYDSMNSPTADAVDMLAVRVAALEDYIDAISGGGGLLECYNYFGECTDAENVAAKTVNNVAHLGSVIPDGTSIRVRFTNAVKLLNNSGLTLNVNQSGDKPIYVDGTDDYGVFDEGYVSSANSVLSFTYDGNANSGNGAWRLEGGYAINAGYAASAGAIEDNGVITESIANGAVATVKIADSAVTTAKLADSSVVTAKIADDAITNAKIADNAVDTDKILDISVTTDKLSDGAVTTAKLASNAVTTAKVSDYAVTTAKIANDAVTKAKLSNELERLSDVFDCNDTVTAHPKLVINNDDIETIQVQPMVDFQNEVQFNGGSTTYMNTDLDIGSRHTLTVNGDTVLGNSDTNTIQFGTGAALSAAEINEVLNQSIETISTATASITAENNTEYRCSAALTSLTLDYPSGLTSSSKFGALIYFKTGSAALAINYVKTFILSGTNVSIGEADGQSICVFDPQPNMRYTLGLMWDGSAMNGIIRGVEPVFTPTTTEEVETNGNTD